MAPYFKNIFIRHVSDCVDSAFGAVYQDDLFESLTEEGLADDRLPSGVTVKDIMDTWTLQKGYPLLKVRQHTSDNTVTISQVIHMENDA